MPRLRAYEPDGTEHYVPQPTSEDAVLQLAQAVYAAEVEAKPVAQPAGPAAAAPGDAAAEPADASYKLAVESLLTARAELEPMLDIIAHLETNEHVSIVEVQRPSAKVEALISDLAVRAQSKYSEIGAASETLIRASAALRVSAERSRRFFAELAELQHAARLLPASDAPSAHASFIFDVSFPGVRAPPPAEVQVLVGPSDTGSVCTIGVQPPAEGVDRVREVIRAKKAAHFHSTLTRHLREEVGAISATDPTGILAALEAELQVALKARSEGAELSPMARAWLRLTDSFFLEVLAWTAAGGAAASGAAARSEPPRVLPRLLSHLQHAASARRTHLLLTETAGVMRGGAAGAPGLPLVLLRHNTGDPLVSAWELDSPGLPPVSVVLRGAELHIEGVRTDESLDLPAAGIKVTPSWLAFWVADSVCKHVLNALRKSAAAAGVEVASGRRHLRTVGGKRAVRIAGSATREGGITWEVTTEAGASVAVPSNKGVSIVDALAGLMR